MSNVDTQTKSHEQRLRRMARRQGLTLMKSRRRDPRALDYGKYFLVKNLHPGSTHWRSQVLMSSEYGMDLNQVEAWLNDEPKDEDDDDRVA